MATPTQQQVAQDLGVAIKQSAKELGVELRLDLANVTLYAAERTAYLASLVGQAGYDEAVIAERDNVVLRAGISSVQSADKLDQRIVGLIYSTLLFGAQALAGGSQPAGGGGVGPIVS